MNSCASSMGLMKLGDGGGGNETFVVLAGVSGGSRKGTAFSERVVSVALRTCLKLMRCWCVATLITYVATLITYQKENSLIFTLWQEAQQ
uniref:Uncharacterized protein n=1 Tax=Timema tahoe TaxID=61484 RepID=A0A7R9ISR5_9NEOP|nr:unnamed protein product [Timema tahoe]